MAYRVQQTNKKNGVTYVYDVVSVWHKELGQSRNKQVCVGKLDKVRRALNARPRVSFLIEELLPLPYHPEVPIIQNDNLRGERDLQGVS